MNYTISNDELTLGFSTTGGTLTSIRDREGVEYLWCGDKNYWGSQAPILFPICGSIRDDKGTLLNGKEIAMGRHGIIRKKEFTMEELTEDSITFSIENDDDMLKLYPFAFKVYAKYTLSGKSIVTEYRVANKSDETMPFFFGGHPGFSCPISKELSYNDYYIEFEQVENCSVPTLVTSTGLIDMEHRLEGLTNTNRLPLTHEMFHVDGIAFDEMKSRKVTLKSDKDSRSVEVDFAQFPYLIIWSSNNDGDFVAIEPWIGLSTCSDEDDILEHKRNVQYVAAGEEKAYRYTIRVM